MRVRAGNAWGWSAPSADVPLVVDGTTGVPLSPSDLAATVAETAVSLSWAPPPSGTLPTAYVVEAGLLPDALHPVAPAPTTTVTAAISAAQHVLRSRAGRNAGRRRGRPRATIVVVVP